MEPRMNSFEKNPAAYKALFQLGAYVHRSGLEINLLQLIEYRVSTINGCSFCLDMHSKDLRAGGETEQRIYMLAGWEETDIYSEREKAALAWAEAVTVLGEGRVPDTVFERAHDQFTDAELIDLTLAICVINSYNRLNVAFRTAGGSYKPGQFNNKPAVAEPVH